MSFMQPQIMKDDWYEVEANNGTDYVPVSACGKVKKTKQLRDYVEGEPKSRKLLKGWFGARLSAPGFLDCTEWSVFKTVEEAEKYLEETYGDDEEMNTTEKEE